MPIGIDPGHPDWDLVARHTKPISMAVGRIPTHLPFGVDPGDDAYGVVCRHRSCQPRQVPTEYDANKVAFLGQLAEIPVEVKQK